MKNKTEELQTNLKFHKEDLAQIIAKNKILIEEAFDHNTDWIRTGKLKKAIASNNKEIDRLNSKVRTIEVKLSDISRVDNKTLFKF